VRVDPVDARDRFARADVLRLATADADGRPHVVPCTFAVDGAGRVVIGVDHKPKSSARLRRLANIEANPRVSMLVDHYAADWEQLWWARADGIATVELSGEEHGRHWELLRAKYPQYAGQALDGPVIAVRVTAWTGWAFRLARASP
jgi:PPOX class probable F420-dependent enzyme